MSVRPNPTAAALLVLLSLLAVGPGHAAAGAAGVDGTAVGGDAAARPSGAADSCLVFRRADANASESPVGVRVTDGAVEVRVDRDARYELACPVAAPDRAAADPRRS